MSLTIERESGEHYFNGDFVETVLFTNGKFVIMYNGVAIVNNCYGELPEGVVANDVIRIRMADHVSPPGIESGTIAVFMLTEQRAMIYEYWTNPKMCHSTGTNGFWKSTNLKLDHTNQPIKVIDVIDEERSTETVKVTKGVVKIGTTEYKL